MNEGQASIGENSGKAAAGSWPPALAVVAALLLLAMVLYWPSVSYLLHLWNDLSVGEYGHGYLVLAISGYLVYIKRRQLAALSPTPVLWPVPAILAASLLWLLAALGDIAVVQPVALLLLIFALLWSLLGHRIMRLLAFPVLFILFAIPVWYPLSLPLQGLTADAVFYVIRLLRIPAYLQENRIMLPAGVLSVEESCSGLRYLLAALTLGALYAYLNYVRPWARILVVLIAAAAAVLANMLRVLIVVYLGYSTEMQHALIKDHLMLGWYLFGGLVLLLLFIDSRFYQPAENGEKPPGRENHAAAATATLLVATGGTPARWSMVAVLALLAVLSGPMTLQWILAGEAAESETAYQLELPAATGAWQGPFASRNDWQPKYHGAISAKQDYKKQGQDLSLYIACYPRQRQGAELVNQLNRISRAKVWRPEYSHPHTVSVDGLEMLEQSLRKGQQRRLVWYWYNIGGQLTVKNYMAKFWQLLGRFSARQSACMVAISLPVAEDDTASRQLLQDFVLQMQDRLLRVDTNAVD